MELRLEVRDYPKRQCCGIGRPPRSRYDRVPHTTASHARQAGVAESSPASRVADWWRLGYLRAARGPNRDGRAAGRRGPQCRHVERALVLEADARAFRAAL